MRRRPRAPSLFPRHTGGMDIDSHERQALLRLVLAELSGQCAFPPGVLNILYASDEDATIWVSELGS